MGRPTILVVDDERDLADLYAMWAGEKYRTMTAYGGEDALEKIDESVDVVLLDRRMPDLTGDEVLERIRETDHEVRVVMITAVDPGLDIIEMEFDKYLTKPISRPKLQRVIENMRVQMRKDGVLQKHDQVSNKMEALEDELEPEALEQSEGYSELQETLQELGDTLTEDFDEDGFDADGAESGESGESDESGDTEPSDTEDLTGDFEFSAGN
jgi:DNA-binding response OmpR family regulator